MSQSQTSSGNSVMAVESAVYAFAKLPATREPVSLGPYALNWSMLNFVLMSVRVFYCQFGVFS